MNKIMKNLLLLVSFAVIGFSTVSAQTVDMPTISETNTSVTLKTLRALFPDQPVAVANELFGGLHSVQTVTDLEAIDTAMLQVGMLVNVQADNMYFRYIGTDQNNDGPDDAATTGAYGENTANWESLADMLLNTAIRDSIGSQIGDSLALLMETSSSQVFTDTTVDATRPFIEGDIAILGDTSLVFDEGEWVLLAENRADSVTYADGISATGPTQTGAVSGDMVLDTAGGFVTTYVYDGDDWTVISILDTLVQATSFSVYVDSTGTIQKWFTVSSLEEFRAQVSSNSGVSGTDGVTLYYPAAWGDFTYSIGYPVINPTMWIELTNGVSTSAAATEVTESDYKKVAISSKNATVQIR